jgi:hypothetical protein
MMPSKYPRSSSVDGRGHPQATVVPLPRTSPDLSRSSVSGVAHRFAASLVSRSEVRCGRFRCAEVGRSAHS